MNHTQNWEQKVGHTPGPFTYRRHRDGVDDFWQIVACADVDQVLASIFFWCDDPVAELQERESNARLFAAAPELLAALRGVLAVGPHGEEEYDAAVEVALAAIAKVEGRVAFP